MTAQAPAEAAQVLKVTYLVAAYPAVSHTFIAREVEALRARGVDISTFSIRKAPGDQLLTDEDAQAARETFSLLPLDRVRFLAAHGSALLKRPGGYLRSLRLALRMSAGGARATLWQLFYFAEAILVWDECRRRGVRHIHAHFANVACAVALLAADFGRPDGFRWSFTMHGPTEFDDVTRFALRDKVEHAAFVACISDYCRSQLQKLVGPELWDKLTIVHCGLPGPQMADSVPVTPADHGGFRVLCVGRLVPEKGQAILLEAASALRRRGLALSVTLVGDGPARASLEAEARRLGIGGDVTFLGALGRDTVARLYSETDAFCLPSFAEGVPVVLMEAMAAGLPVVTTRIAGVPELVEDEVSGAVVAPGRSEPIAEALGRLAADPELRGRWGAAGREKVMRDYDVADSAEILERLFTARGAPAGL